MFDNFLALYDVILHCIVFAMNPAYLSNAIINCLACILMISNVLYFAMKQGYLPDAMINYLALLGWNDGTDQDIYTRQELIEAFDLNRVTASPAQFDQVRTGWAERQGHRYKHRHRRREMDREKKESVYVCVCARARARETI